MNAVVNDPLLLPRLLIGFEALRERYARRQFYPYPETLHIAWNALSVRQLVTGHRPVVALTELINLCTKPVGTWYPAPLPDDWPFEARILREGGGIELTDWAFGFLSEQISSRERIKNLADAEKVELALQNRLFVRIWETLRQSKYPQRAQADYILLRRFLIQNPFTTRAKILSTFGSTSIKPLDVGEFYEDCEQGRPYHCCQHCGPLFLEHGRWRGAKSA